MAKKLKEFTVSQSKWWRGKGYGSLLMDPSQLDNKTHAKQCKNLDKRCCLGFLARDLGYEDKELLHQSYPHNVDKSIGADIKWPGGSVNSVYLKIAKTNDNKKLTDKNRKDRLRRLFSKLGVKVHFGK